MKKIEVPGSTTPDQLDGILRRRGGSGSGEPEPPRLKDIIDALTHSFRRAAKLVVREEIFALERELASDADPVAATSIEDSRLEVLNAQFNTIVRGGFKGAVAAVGVLLARRPAPGN